MTKELNDGFESCKHFEKYMHEAGYDYTYLERQRKCQPSDELLDEQVEEFLIDYEIYSTSKDEVDKVKNLEKKGWYRMNVYDVATCIKIHVKFVGKHWIVLLDRFVLPMYVFPVNDAKYKELIDKCKVENITLPYSTMYAFAHYLYALPLQKLSADASYDLQLPFHVNVEKLRESLLNMQ